MNIKYTYITKQIELKTILKEIEELKKESFISLDVETSGMESRRDNIRLVQLKINNNIYILNIETLEMKYLVYILNLLEEKEVTFILQNAKFDLKFIYHNINIMLSKVYDSMVAESVISGAKLKYSSLVVLLKKYLGVVLDKEVRLDFVEKDTITEEMLIYSALDVEYLYDLLLKQYEEVVNLKLVKVINLEMKIIPAVAKMEYDGITFNKDKWIALSELSLKNKEIYYSLMLDSIWNSFMSSNGKIENAFVLFEKFNIPVKTKKLRVLLESITDLSNVEDYWREHFNVSSIKQVRTALNLCSIPVDNLKEATLSAIEDKYEIVSTLLEYKSWDKKCSTYGIEYLNYISDITGKIHAEFNQNGTETGRFACSKPNLQQVPTDTVDGVALWRECFISSEDYLIISVDYSQQEYKIVGELSGEPKIIDAYKAGIDMHTATASIIYDVPIEDVDSKQRYDGKTINFGLLFGMTKWGLAKKLLVTKPKAQRFIDKIIKGYPIFAEFRRQAEEIIFENMYSRTMLGRIRFFKPKKVFEVDERFDLYKARILREGFNHIIQGTAADMLKLALMYSYYDNPFGEDFRVLLLIHDEIVVEAKEEIIDEAKEFLISCMDRAFEYFVKEIKSGVNAQVKESWTK